MSQELTVLVQNPRVGSINQTNQPKNRPTIGKLFELNWLILHMLVQKYFSVQISPSLKGQPSSISLLARKKSFVMKLWLMSLLEEKILI